MKGFILPCSQRGLYDFIKQKQYETHSFGPLVVRVEKDDILFLYNSYTDKICGVFQAISDGYYINGSYKVDFKNLSSEFTTINRANRLLSKLNLTKYNIVVGKKLLDLVDSFASFLFEGKEFYIDKKRILDYASSHTGASFFVPPLEIDTCWMLTGQDYGILRKGDNKYNGVTPALVIYNLIWRYTKPGDVVLDPMAGSGTTIDVCKEEKRKCIAYDIVPVRGDIKQNDARSLPLEDESVDLIFIDSPYGDNIKYNEHEDCLGKISAESPRFYEEMEKVVKECFRVLKRGKVLGWLIADQYRNKRFVPTGFNIYNVLANYFETVDIVCIPYNDRATSCTGKWKSRALKYNFFLRGFRYLFVMRKH